MDVKLYVYDLSKGLARMYSAPLTGTHIDAIYHTSIVLDGIEYYFGQGIQTAAPGSTHHGHPMEVVQLGQTELPKDVVDEYIQSLEAVYTPESYDLFLHNCNNFTHDLATFLIGKGIPEHIRNLPQTFLNTPFGQMMKPQIEMALRGVTQGSGTAGVPQPPPAAGVHHHPPLAGSGAAGPGHTPGLGRAPGPGHTAATAVGTVRIVSNVQQLDEQFAQAVRRKAGVVIFFTSATCPPCKMVYPTYDELAEEAGDRAILVKVDISTALDVGMKYGVRATPTFMTFLREQKIDEWSGANPGQLRGNVRLLIQMNQHPHRKLQLPSLQRIISQYILYKKVPPLEKVCAKLAPYDKGPAITSLIEFLQARNNNKTAADIPIPDTLPAIATYLQTTPQHLPRENHFAVVDLARLLFLDPRVSGYFAERDPDHKTLFSLLSLASPSPSPGGVAGAGAAPHEKPPYNLRMVLLQLICNLFTTPLYTTHLASNHTLRSTCLALATTGSLLDDDTDSVPASLRVAATSCIYNFAVLNHNARLEGSGSGSARADQPPSEPLSEEEQVELTAAVIEALGREEESAETVRGLVFALGLLVYEAETGSGEDGGEGEGEGAVVDVCRAMGVEGVLKGKERFKEGEGLIREVGRLFE